MAAHVRIEKIYLKFENASEDGWRAQRFPGRLDQIPNVGLKLSKIWKFVLAAASPADVSSGRNNG